MFRVVTKPADLLAAYCVRSIVFVGEQRCSFREEFDGLDDEAIHVLGEQGGEPVAAGRVRAVDGGWAKLERIAVLEPARGHGLGHRLVEFLLEVARQNGHCRFKLHAQAHLERFYERHGFERRGEMFLEAGIDHVLMVRYDQ
jgi:predicted GNAT family N-acyltransferase